VSASQALNGRASEDVILVSEYRRRKGPASLLDFAKLTNQRHVVVLWHAEVFWVFSQKSSGGFGGRRALGSTETVGIESHRDPEDSRAVGTTA
jgi:hypothetical protein